MKTSIGILGFGHAVPKATRTNDDALFSHVKSGMRHQNVTEAQLFTGIKERRYLLPEESVESLMVKAGQMALREAGLRPTQIGRLYGAASMAEFVVPNGLFHVHRQLELERGAMVIPVQSEFTNFSTSLVLAAEGIAAGACEYAMINCGGAWTRNVDYSHPHALGIGDGAAAVIMGATDRFALVDYSVETHSEEYDTMVLPFLANQAQGTTKRGTFVINEAGIRSFLSHGIEVPCRLTRELLERNHVSSEQITLITHQPSNVLMDAWMQSIQPKVYLNTLEEYGNMTVATVPWTLAANAHQITTDYVAMIQLGLGAHFTVTLLKR